MDNFQWIIVVLAIACGLWAAWWCRWALDMKKLKDEQNRLLEEHRLR